MPTLRHDGIQLWTDFEAASGSVLHVVSDAVSVVQDEDVEKGAALEVTIPYTSEAWDHIAERRVVRLTEEDGTVEEWRIVAIDTDDHPLRGKLVCESALLELRGPGLCERVETTGLARTRFTVELSPTEHLDNVILAAGPSWITSGTVDPTADESLTYEHATPLEALQDLAEVTSSEIALRRQANGTYLLDLVTQVGSGADTPVFQLGKNLRHTKRLEDDRDTVTKIYAFSAEGEFGEGSLADARWEVTARDTTADYVEVSPNPVWKDDALNGLYIGNPDRTEVQQVTDSVNASARIYVADASLYAVGEELQLFRNASGDDLNYVEDPDAISSDTDRKVEVLTAPDLPAARNLAPNPKLDQYTAGSPDNVSQVGTPTTFAEYTGDDYSEYGRSSLHVVTDAAEEGAISDAITIEPTDERPYFSGLVHLKIVSGAVRFELEHSTMGTIPAEDSQARAVSDKTGVWIDLIISPAIEFESGTVQLRVVSDDGAAEFYLDGWQLVQFQQSPAFVGGNVGNELWDRAVARFTDDEVTSPTFAYDVEAVDLSDAIYDFDALTLGGEAQLVHEDLGIDTTVRVTRLRRDRLQAELVKIGFANRRGELIDVERKLKEREDPTSTPTGAIALTKFQPFVGDDGVLYIDYAGEARVKSILWATSTSSQPSRSDALSGTAQNGRTGRFSTGVTVDPNSDIYLTVVPTSATGGAGARGRTYEWSNVRLTNASPEVRLKDVTYSSDATSGLADLTLVIEDPQQKTGGTVSVWMNKSSTASPDPTGTRDGYVSADHGDTVDDTTTFNLEPSGTDTLLNDVRVPLGGNVAKLVYAQWESPDKRKSVLHVFKLLPAADLFNDKGQPQRTKQWADGGYALRAKDTAGKEAFDDLWIPDTKSVKVGTVASPSSLTKTLTLSHGMFTPGDETMAWKYFAEYLACNATSDDLYAYASFSLPPGVDITKLEARLFREVSGSPVAQLDLYRLNDDGSAGTIIATCTSTTTGSWQTVSDTLSETVGSSAYLLRVRLYATNTANGARIMWAKVTYDMPSYDKTI